MSFLSRLMLDKSRAHFSSNGQKGAAAPDGKTFKGSAKRKGELAR